MFVKGAQTPEQLEAMALSMYINELGDRINHLHRDDPQTNLDLVPRSPSPPPEYNNEGRRTNTRFSRTLHKLEVEQTEAIHRALELIPDYNPPANFTKFTRSTHKFYLPVHEHPQINFIGLLLGPRGKNLRNMEHTAGAKISIRGRGSVKEGSRFSSQMNEDELHCLISSTSQQSIQHAIKLIQDVINTAISTPDDMNAFKKSQLRELAQINGTFRDDERQETERFPEVPENHFEPRKRDDRVNALVEKPAEKTEEKEAERESKPKLNLKVQQLMSEVRKTEIDKTALAAAIAAANDIDLNKSEVVFDAKIPPGTSETRNDKLVDPPPSFTPAVST